MDINNTMTNDTTNKIKGSYYECRRCGYTTKYKSDMKRHLEKRKKCLVRQADRKEEDVRYRFASMSSLVDIDRVDIKVGGYHSLFLAIICYHGKPFLLALHDNWVNAWEIRVPKILE